MSGGGRRGAAGMAAACAEIARGLAGSGDLRPSRIRSEIRRACARHSLGRIPRNREILDAASGPEFEALRAALLKRPARTGSGVAVVALMPVPYACPHGRCTFCPGGAASNSPNSYTGSEAATVAAVAHNYDPAGQIRSRLASLESAGHGTSKTEVVIVGGTFLFMPAAYREWFVRSCYEALNGQPSAGLGDAQRANEGAAVRCVGLAIETKPDYCRREHVDEMLRYGATRVEIGVQSLRPSVYAAVNRGHTYGDVTGSFRVSRDAGYKVAAHMMPGLPTMTPGRDIEDFGRLFSDPDLRPDMLKIYPALVVRGTPLHDDYVRGRYEPYSDAEMVRVLAEAKKRVPKWVRIMRVQREIPPSEIVAGPRAGNIRQEVLRRMREEGSPCRCIRCREPGPGASGVPELALDRADYAASGGREVFLSFEDARGSVYGFLRLRHPSPEAHRPEVQDSCIVRELHVYGRSVGIGGRGGIQHSGLGSRLMAEAERISAGEFGARRLLVISGIGARRYYARLGYSREGPYMCRGLA